MGDLDYNDIQPLQPVNWDEIFDTTWSPNFDPTFSYHPALSTTPHYYPTISQAPLQIMPAATYDNTVALEISPEEIMSANETDGSYSSNISYADTLVSTHTTLIGKKRVSVLQFSTLDVN
jgi:hypothetical protein